MTETAAPFTNPEAIGAIVREHWGRVTAALVMRLGQLELAEDALQDAYVAALTHWPQSGLPDHPQAWLLRTAERKAVDILRRGRVFQSKQQQLQLLAEIQAADDAPDDLAASDPFPDERLRLVFTCCHPALGHDASVALTLKTVCGLNTPQIARAFLQKETAVAQRIVRAKRKIAHAGIPYAIPQPEDWPERLEAVLAVIYFIFNEGYAALQGDRHSRIDLCEEAIHLGRVMLALAPDENEVRGLLALMLLHHSRRHARCGPQGEIVSLEVQDRSCWDKDCIRAGLALLQGTDRVPPGRYALQARLSAVHARAPSFAQTNWVELVRLYDAVYAQAPNPVVLVNRAVALSYAQSPAAGLEALDALRIEPRLAGYQPYHAARADLLARSGDIAAARQAFGRAIELSGNEAEIRFLQQRLKRMETAGRGVQFKGPADAGEFSNRKVDDNSG